MLRRIVCLASPLLVALLASACMVTTKVEKKTQRVRISSDPGRAYVWQVKDGEKKALGYTPTELKVPYESQSEGINSAWWWTAIGITGAASVSGAYVGWGVENGEVGQYVMYGSLALGLGAILVFYLADNSLKAKGSTLSEPEEIQILAQRDGYLDQQTVLKVPSQQRSLRLNLPPDPSKAHLRARPEPVRPKPEPRPPVEAQPSPVGQRLIVAVFDVRDESRKFNKRDTEQLTEYLAASLTATGRFQVVPRDQLRKRLATQKRASYRKCYDESCQLELGKAMAAEKTLATKLLRVGKRCAVVATLYDLKTETTERSAVKQTDCTPDLLMKQMDEITSILAGAGD